MVGPRERLLTEIEYRSGTAVKLLTHLLKSEVYQKTGHNAGQPCRCGLAEVMG